MMERRPLVAIGQKATDVNIFKISPCITGVDLDIVHLKQCWPVCIIVFLSNKIKGLNN